MIGFSEGHGLAVLDRRDAQACLRRSLRINDLAVQHPRGLQGHVTHLRHRRRGGSGEVGGKEADTCQRDDATAQSLRLSWSPTCFAGIKTPSTSVPSASADRLLNSRKFKDADEQISRIFRAGAILTPRRCYAAKARGVMPRPEHAAQQRRGSSQTLISEHAGAAN